MMHCNNHWLSLSSVLNGSMWMVTEKSVFIYDKNWNVTTAFIGDIFVVLQQNILPPFLVDFKPTEQIWSYAQILSRYGNQYIEHQFFHNLKLIT